MLFKSQSCTHNMVVKTSRHRYGTKLLHYHHRAYVCYETTRQTSSMQNGERQVGHGHRQLSHISGWAWSWRLANQRPMHSRHHIGRQWQMRHGDRVSVSSTQRRDSLMHATACMQPTHWSNSCTHSVHNHQYTPCLKKMPPHSFTNNSVKN